MKLAYTVTIEIDQDLEAYAAGNVQDTLQEQVIIALFRELEGRPGILDVQVDPAN